MTNLRREAIDRMCQIRLHGCKGAPCCLAHWRQHDISGMGMKAPDLLGAHACDGCHKAYDTRGRGERADTIELAFLQGVIRTQDWLIGKGWITW